MKFVDSQNRVSGSEPSRALQDFAKRYFANHPRRRNSSEGFRCLECGAAVRGSRCRKCGSVEIDV